MVAVMRVMCLRKWPVVKLLCWRKRSNRNANGLPCRPSPIFLSAVDEYCPPGCLRKDDRYRRVLWMAAFASNAPAQRVFKLYQLCRKPGCADFNA